MTWVVLTSVCICSWLLKNSFKLTTKDSACILSLPIHSLCLLSKVSTIVLKKQRTVLKTNNSVEWMSPWNIPLFTPASQRSSPLDVSNNFHCFILFSKNASHFSIAYLQFQITPYTNWSSCLEQNHTFSCSLSRP